MGFIMEAGRQVGEKGGGGEEEERKLIIHFPLSLSGKQKPVADYYVIQVL